MSKMVMIKFPAIISLIFCTSCLIGLLVPTAKCDSLTSTLMLPIGSIETKSLVEQSKIPPVETSQVAKGQVVESDLFEGSGRTSDASSTGVASAKEKKEDSPEGGEAPVTTTRIKRAASSRAARVQLAQTPARKMTTTTSTSTTTSSTTESTGVKVGEEEEKEYEDESSVGDAGAEAATPKKPAKVTTTTPKAAKQRKEPPTTSSKQSSKQRAKAQTSSKVPVESEREQEEEQEEQEEAEEAEEERQIGTDKSPKVEQSAANGESSAAGVPPESSEKRQRVSRKPLFTLDIIKKKDSSICTPEAYLEFPRDLVGNKWRRRGLVVIHLAVVCYMFYSLALVCDKYFMPSLEEFALRLNLSEDVAGATLMSAGSSAPELFTAILGVFIVKGDVGTGTIVGSAVFNILFVIGVCAFVSATTAQLNWWPVLRDSVFYTFTVLVLILFIYDEKITALESLTMLALYGVYIMVMIHNESVKQRVTLALNSHPLTARLVGSTGGGSSDDVFGGGGSSSMSMAGGESTVKSSSGCGNKDLMYLAALLVMMQHRRLFSGRSRFQAAARYVITKRQHRRAAKRTTGGRQQQKQQQQQQQQVGAKTTADRCSVDIEVNYFEPETEPLRAKNNQHRDRIEAFSKASALSKNKFSIVSKDNYEFWNRPPEEGENYYLWMAKIPVNYVLHYTTPDCSLYPDKYLLTFAISILWTAFFSYVMVWMVTLVGYTFGIPDSVMGFTFLAAGTSIPDCYSSIHAARHGMADMAVSNSIGSNVFDILVGLALPWFIQTAVYPQVTAKINSNGIIYSVILLFISLVVTIYLLHRYEWTLRPRLGLALLAAYGLFIVLTCMLEFNLFGHVNPPSCQVDQD